MSGRRATCKNLYTPNRIRILTLFVNCTSARLCLSRNHLIPSELLLFCLLVLEVSILEKAHQKTPYCPLLLLLDRSPKTSVWARQLAPYLSCTNQLRISKALFALFVFLWSYSQKGSKRSHLERRKFFHSIYVSEPLLNMTYLAPL